MFVSFIFLGVEIVDGKSFTISPAISSFRLKVKFGDQNLKVGPVKVDHEAKLAHFSITQDAGVENKKTEIVF